jgi:putative transposase
VTRAQTVGFSDELRLGLIGQTRRVWAPVGVKVVQPLQYERAWCYVLLVVDGRLGRLWWSWTLGMGAADLQPEVAKWSGAGIEAVVWDRAPAHQTLSGQPQDVTLILQPPSSPELNPAERVIEAIRQRLEGLVYASLPEKYAAVTAFLEELDADPARVRSLTGWGWIQDNLDRLPIPYDIAA